MKVSVFDPTVLIHKSAIEFVRLLPTFFPTAVDFQFFIYQPYKGVEKRIEHKYRKRNYKKSLFGELKWSFEKDLILQVQDNLNNTPLIEELTSHDNERENEKIHSVASIQFQNWLSLAEEALSTEEAIGLCSKCTTSDGQILHIPMMDFSCPPDENSLTFLKEAFRSFGLQEGVFFDSGRSYHFYGLQLLDETEWRSFMGKCILLEPFTDVRYIAHRLISGKAILRLTPSKLKPQIPTIVGFL